MTTHGPLMVTSTYRTFPPDVRNPRAGWVLRAHTRVLTVERVVLVGLQGTGQELETGRQLPHGRRAALVPTCPPHGLPAAVGRSPLSPGAQNSYLRSRGTMTAWHMAGLQG